MTDLEIKASIQAALDELLQTSDSWLIKNNLSEQSITHRIALHLANPFKDYDVDCEYNGDVDSQTGRKKIGIVKEHLANAGLLRKGEGSSLEEEYVLRAVFPDIIIHKRGTNAQNLCIIEVKKSTSSVPFDYDYIKLCAYTSDQPGNHLSYQLGIFLKVNTANDNPSFEWAYFKNGGPVDSLE